ncbi:TonB-dependent receptor [Acidicapsa acidisoli]|uniref:TonB-dependent receptor n=1 Tax=Acidicapsa acidisoli TaxID=1615681 RepID=UPI0021E01494|nr:carboxypeptidase-like regulatory domain-containing protein [Acidicapsa acidisoli]
MTRVRFRWPMLTTMLLVWMCAGATLILGQATNTGTVVGVVTDQSSAVVPGALITLTDPATNTSLTTTTNHAGEYVMQNVAPGKYDITVNKSGFRTDKIVGQTIEVGTQTTANFKLQVGSTQQTVEVQAMSTDLQTLNSTVGGTVDSEAIDSLPSLLHDVGTFTELQPGVSPDGSVAGAVGDQSTFSLDGGNNTNDMDGDMSVYTPSFAGDPTGIANQNAGVAAGPTGVLPTPADSVEEFKVNTANQTADFNNSAGAQVEIVTKRGTNQVHGSVYEYYLDNNFSANTWDNNLSGTPLPSYHYSKFGAGAGGPIAPSVLGGKTYLFALYQGWRYPNAQTYERVVPSANMRNGIVTFGGTTYDLKALDPRGIGVNPDVQTMWNKYEPPGNDTSCGSLLGTYCDGVNEVGFKGNLALPERDDFMVARLDHDFGDKWHFMTSYRYYRLTRATTNQVDIGGFFSGDKLGTPASAESRPQQPWYLVAGLTTNITAHMTNDFHYSFLRNYWSWSDNNAPPQISGLGGALEPFGESATKALVPFNVDTQDIRTRFWDGEDHFLRDDVSFLRGNHLLQFGGQYQHNFNYHQRTDNGGGINFTPTYQLGDSVGSGLIDLSALTAQGYPTGAAASRVAAAVYGMVTDSQVAYTRSGNSLTLNAPLTPASDKVTIPYYNVYFSDTWHMKPSFTLSFGMGWTLEMPPTEATGKQVEIVDASDEPIKTTDYLAQRKANALAGQAYNPELGFALVGNVGAGLKYPYNPFYGSFSPRVGAAWNPHFASDTVLGHLFGPDATVIRGGYGRIYGRLNGVDLVLVPLLGIGLIQPVQCRQALASGACGPANPTATTAFRIGVDGTSAPLAAASPTLPQPVYPGYNSAAGSASEGLDPEFRPNAVDSFDLTIQRQITRKTLIEVGYIGRLIHHEYQPVNLNAVPYMMTAGTQNFAQAYAALEKQLGCATSAAQCGAGGMPSAVSPQSFFENALKGTSYCAGFANCTTAVMNNEYSNLITQSVWSLWSDLDNGGFNFPRTMMNTPIPGSANGGSGQSTSGIAENASIGHGNYNGGFVSFALLDWHGLTMHENFTYSKALGTGAEVQATSEYTPNDPFNLDAMYGVQPFNRKLVFNTYMVWQDPYYKGQQGLMGRLAGGWSFAPIFTAGNGEPLYCNTNTDGQAFGGADGANYFDNEQCVFTSKYTAGVHSHYNISGGTDPYGNSVGTAVAGSGGAAVNMFKNPVAVFDQVRAPILGIDTKNPGVGPINGTPYWNVDMSLQKNIKIWERTTLQFSMIFTNVFNHNILVDPGGTSELAINSPSTWGVQSSQANIPRKMEFGLRVSF